MKNKFGANALAYFRPVSDKKGALEIVIIVF
jgi:hypothetical protein